MPAGVRALIPDSFKQDLLARVDIVDVVGRYVQLKKAGANYQGLCPFHSEKSPSFTVSPSKQFYHCFGCGAHGNAIGFLMAHSGLGYVDAVKDLASSAGMQVPDAQPRTPEQARRQARETDLYAVMERAMDFFRAELKKSKRAIDYLKGRGLSGEIAARFGIGYAPDDWQGLRRAFPDYADSALVECGLVIASEDKRYDRFRDRIMFPIFSARGAVIGFGGRVLGDGEPKYLNSPETPLFEKGREVYGLIQAREPMRNAGRILVVEGYMDVVALAQYGIGYAVATLGTATTPIHIGKLLRLTDEIVFSFDGDKAGRKAAWRALEVALPLVRDDKPMRFLFLPDGDDPDSYVRQHGQEAFERRLREAQPLSSFLLAELRAASDLSSAEGRSRFLVAAKPHLQKVAAPALRLQLVKEIASAAQVTQDEAARLLELSVPKTVYSRPAPARVPAAVVTRQEQHLLRYVLSQPSLVREIDFSLLDEQQTETRALRAIADWMAEDGTAAAPSVLIEHFGATDLAPLIFEVQAKSLEQGLTEEMAQREFEQCLLSLRIQREVREIEALRRVASPGRDVVVELERRTRELAQLKNRRS
jgi:DNA primase